MPNAIVATTTARSSSWKRPSTSRRNGPRQSSVIRRDLRPASLESFGERFDATMRGCVHDAPAFVFRGLHDVVREHFHLVGILGEVRVHGEIDVRPAESADHLRSDTSSRVVGRCRPESAATQSR